MGFGNLFVVFIPSCLRRWILFCQFAAVFRYFGLRQNTFLPKWKFRGSGEGLATTSKALEMIKILSWGNVGTALRCIWRRAKLNNKWVGGLVLAPQEGGHGGLGGGVGVARRYLGVICTNVNPAQLLSLQTGWEFSCAWLQPAWLPTFSSYQKVISVSKPFALLEFLAVLLAFIFHISSVSDTKSHSKIWIRYWKWHKLTTTKTRMWNRLFC